MINIRTIKKLVDGDGLTLKAGKIIRYKTGWQVADTGVECYNPQDCINAVRAHTRAIAVYGLRMVSTM